MLSILFYIDIIKMCLILELYHLIYSLLLNCLLYFTLMENLVKVIKIICFIYVRSMAYTSPYPAVYLRNSDPLLLAPFGRFRNTKLNKVVEVFIDDWQSVSLQVSN